MVAGVIAALMLPFGYSSAGAGETGSDPQTRSETEQTGIALRKVPRVIAAKSRADVPMYFEVLGVDKAEIVSVTATFEVNSSLTLTATYTGDQRLVAGDAIGTQNGDTSSDNGDTYHYTTFVEWSKFQNIDLQSTGHYRSDTGKVKITVTYIPEGETASSTDESEWVDLDSVMDKNVDICHLGKSYSQNHNNNPDYPAINPATGANRMAWSEAVPYTSQVHPSPMKWAKHTSTSSGTWWQYSTKTENVEWCPTIAFFYRCRNAHWLSGWYNITTAIHTGYIPHADDGEVWQELMASEERGAIVIWYWGQKEITDLSGNQLTVIDLRAKIGSSNLVDLYPGATVRLTVLDIGAAQAWSWSTLRSSMTITSGVLTLVSIAGGPVGWATTALKYATLVGTYGSSASAVLGGLANATTGDEGGKASAYGVITKTKRDGTPYIGSYYGSPNQGLGGPNLNAFTQSSGGSKTPDASVYYSDSALALETWKVIHSATTASWGEEGWLFSSENRARLEFFRSSSDPDGNYCKADSGVSITTDAGEYVGE